MDRHDQANHLYEMQKYFFHIKKISASATIDNFCEAGISKTVVLAHALGIEDALQEVKNRQIDPTM